MGLNTTRLISVLENAGFSVEGASGGVELVIACPLCFHDKRRLYINATTGLWICHRCGEKGHLRRLLTDVCGMPYNEAFAVERSIWGATSKHPLPLQPRTHQGYLADLPPSLLLDDGTGPAADYLRSRGLDVYWVGVLGIGYCLNGRYRFRVIVPVYTEGELRTFVARTWLTNEPKRILTPKGSQAARALFGYDLLPCRIGPGVQCDHPQGILLVEGVFDTLRMWELGYEHTVATLGTHLTDQQRVLLKRLAPPCVTIMRDGDDAGRKAAAKEAQELAASAASPTVYIATLPDGVDPGTATPGEIRHALDTAKPVELLLGTEVTKEEVHQ